MSLLYLFIYSFYFFIVSNKLESYLSNIYKIYILDVNTFKNMCTTSSLNISVVYDYVVFNTSWNIWINAIFE